MTFLIRDTNTLPQLLAQHARHVPWPRAAQRPAWDGLPEPRRQIIAEHAAAARAAGWPALSASAHRACKRSGNRTAFEEPYFARRWALAWWLLDACCQPDTARIDCCIDAIWSLCEESTWCLPAHSAQARADRSPLELPEPEDQFLDLFSAETAAQLASACSLLEGFLPSAVPTRVRYEVQRRLLRPLAAGHPYWWEHGLNNWTPWIASNLLHMACWAMTDPGPLATVVLRLDAAVERYRVRLSPDGGCDEGIGYWNVGYGRLLWFGERLALATGGAYHPQQRPELAAGARFPATIHLGGGAFPTFADSLAADHPLRPVLARALRCFPDPGLAELVQWSLRDWQATAAPDHHFDPGHGLAGGGLHLLLDQCFHCPEADPAWHPQPPPQASWLPQLQWLTAHAGPLAIAAKAGHNGENHNHNDVGQWSVHLNGESLLIDPGRGQYTRASFLPERYDIWYNGSLGHAVPQVAGHGQLPARRFDAAEAAMLLAGDQPTWEDRRIGARAVRFEDHDHCCQLTMDLAPCYPQDCGLRHLWRHLTLDRTHCCLHCHDRAEADPAPELRLPLLATVEPQPQAGGLVLPGRQDMSLLMEWQGWELQDIELVNLTTDPELCASWGQHLWRIHLRAGPGQEGHVSTRVIAHGNGAQHSTRSR